MTLRIYSETIYVSTQTGPDIVNVTSLLASILKKEGIETGTMSLFSVGSTSSLTTLEFEPGVVEDLRRTLGRLAPAGAAYEHEKAWRDGNGHSHVQAALLGPSLCVPVRKGEIAVGTWQQVVLINHDIKPRKRRIEVTIIGLTRGK